MIMTDDDFRVVDKGNGILLVEGKKLTLKTDSNRKIYVKKQNASMFDKPFKSTGVYLPYKLDKEQKKQYLYRLYNMCLEYMEQKEQES